MDDWSVIGSHLDVLPAPYWSEALVERIPPSGRRSGSWTQTALWEVRDTLTCNAQTVQVVKFPLAKGYLRVPIIIIIGM